MWLKLSDGLFYFGLGGITIIKDIDLRDKPDSFIMRSELYAGGVRITSVKETSEELRTMLGGKTDC